MFVLVAQTHRVVPDLLASSASVTALAFFTAGQASTRGQPSVNLSGGKSDRSLAPPTDDREERALDSVPHNAPLNKEWLHPIGLRWYL